VTKPADIATAVATIESAGTEFHGVINNAGVAVVGPLTRTTEEDFDFVMDANVYGPYRVT
jgi:NAD(P)-dependent dehydrogenase (short-subunit alcohol dehydrogenase family)